MALDTYQFINNLKATGLSEQQAVVISNGIKEISQNCDYLSKKDFEIVSAKFLTKEEFYETAKRFLTKEEFYEATKKFLTKEEFYEATKKFLTKDEFYEATKKFVTKEDLMIAIKDMRHTLLIQLGGMIFLMMSLGLTAISLIIKS